MAEAGFASQLHLYVTPQQPAAHTSAPPSPPAAIALSPPNHFKAAVSTHRYTHMQIHAEAQQFSYTTPCQAPQAAQLV